MEQLTLMELSFSIYSFSYSGDEVERSIELLDKVLSEFEDPESLPHIEPDSPSQGHQSEDDGYMSMNGKKYIQEKSSLKR